MYHALVEKGSTAIPMHMALFSIPLKIAVTFGIPLVVWGENSAFEYGSADEEHEGFRLDEAWLKTYGVTNGTTADDWVDHELSRKQLTPYFAPSESDLERVGVLAVFLGYYFQWSPQRSLEVATRHGFESDQDGPRTGLWNYADIDDDFISIHHYLKWYKFGITRLFDNLSIEIRNGRMTRDQAIDVVRDTGDQTPYADIRKFCEFANIAESHFFELIEKFRNSDIWTNDHGVWCINDFLINDWNWQ